jgi:hypothetical protein
VAITGAGNVGIGTTTPGALLQVSKSDATNQLFNVFNSANSGGANNTSFIHTDQNFSVGTTPYTGSALLVTTYPNNVANNSGNVLNVGTSDSAGGSLVSYLVVKAKDGNVGIGTTTPNDLLQLQSTSATAYDPISDNGQFGSGTGITITNIDTTPQSFSQVNMQVSSALGRALGRIVTIRMASATSDMAFVTENANVAAEKMRIAATGNVGIGTTTPAVKLDVIGTTTGSLRMADNETNTTNKLGRIVGRQYTNADTDFLAFDIRGLVSSNEINYGGGSSLLNSITSHTFYTAATTTTIGGTPRMIITSAGNVGIGTTTPTGNLAITQTITATGVLKGIVYTGAVNTNQTLSTEIPSLTLTTAGRQWATGAITTQREVLITQPTYSFVGTSTITDAATLGISGAPIQSTNATITNTHGILIQAGAVSTATNSYGMTVNAQTGATNNYGLVVATGNVGIGTTAPSRTFQINASAGPTVELVRTGFAGGSLYFETDGTDGVIRNPGNNGLSLQTNGANPRLFIANTGNVGIGTGTTTPNDLLQLQSTSATAYDPISDNGQYGSGTGITITNMDTTPQSFSQVNMQVSGASGRALGRIVTIRMASATSDMAFVTENANVAAEKMRIAASGKVTISSAITITGTILDVSSGRSFFAANGEPFAIGARFNSTGGAVYFGATNGSVIPDAQISSAGGGPLMTLKNSGIIQFNNTTFYGAGTLHSDVSGNITSVSDERLKTIDGNFTAGLNEVLQIKPILYHWNELSQLDTENMYAGFSAQNIQSVIPVAVMANKDTGYLSLQDRPIIAALVNAIKEQNDIITNLLSRIVILENK